MASFHRGMLPAPPMSEAERDRLRSLREGGSTWGMIAAAMGCSTYRAMREASAMGLKTAQVFPERKASAVRRDCGGAPLGVWSPVSRAVLADAGLPVPAPGEVW